jgi:hypothetical protein
MAIVSNGRDREGLHISLTDNDCEPGRMLIGKLRVLGQNRVLLIDLATGTARSHYRQRALTGHFLAAGVIRRWVHGRQAKKRRGRSPKHQDHKHNRRELSAPLHAEGSEI